MIYLTDTRDVSFFKKLARQGDVVLMGTTARIVKHIMGLRKSAEGAALLDTVVREVGQHCATLKQTTTTWQSAVRTEEMAEALSFILETDVPISKKPVTLQKEDILIFFAPVVEQLALALPVDDVFDPIEKLCEYSRFYVVLIKELVPAIKDLVI